MSVETKPTALQAFLDGEDHEKRLSAENTIWLLDWACRDNEPLPLVVRRNAVRLIGQHAFILFGTVLATLAAIFMFVGMVYLDGQYRAAVVARLAAERHAATIEARCVCPHVDGTLKTPAGETVTPACVDGAVTWSTP